MSPPATRSRRPRAEAATADPVARRVAAANWAAIAQALDARGFATLPGLLTASECRALASRYDEDATFRSRVVMQQHGYGQGEYRYMAYPLPALVERLRRALYPRLALVASAWRRALGQDAALPPDLDAYLAQCHAAGQTRPTPLLLKYGAGDYNRLHQDLYGALVFPLQLTVLLSDPAHDFTGGAFLLVEQRPRQQSRAEAIALRQGEAVIFAVRERPVPGKRGHYRAVMRHGVSTLHSGQRFTLGIIFHDAK